MSETPGFGGERRQTVKRITLPSGKEVDMVSFVQPDELSSENCGHGVPLACCLNCGHDRVQSTGWSEVGSSHWHVGLRCPDCEERREAIFDQEEVNQFDVALDEGRRSVARDLDLLALANMADDIDRFTRALKDDWILPEDF